MKKRILGYFIKHIQYSILIEKKNYCFSEQLIEFAYGVIVWAICNLWNSLHRWFLKRIQYICFKRRILIEILINYFWPSCFYKHSFPWSNGIFLLNSKDLFYTKFVLIWRACQLSFLCTPFFDLGFFNRESHW